jgi:hypothetical protein
MPILRGSRSGNWFPFEAAAKRIYLKPMAYDPAPANAARLKMFHFIADKIEREPQWLQTGLDNIERWIANGSPSILAGFPELGEAGLLDATFDAGLPLDPVDKGISDFLKEAIGEGSLFEKEKGYHADILHPSIVETLPPGWEGRLAAVKIVAGREKDLGLVRSLLGLGKISGGDLNARWSSMGLGERGLFRSGRNLRGVLQTVERPAPGAL